MLVAHQLALLYSGPIWMAQPQRTDFAACCRIRQQYASSENRDLGQLVVAIALGVVSCLMECVLQLVEFLTKFAVRPWLAG